MTKFQKVEEVDQPSSFPFPWKNCWKILIGSAQEAARSQANPRCASARSCLSLAYTGRAGQGSNAVQKKGTREITQ